MKRPRRAPKLRHRKQTGYYYAEFYDPRRKPTRKWVALGTKNKRRAIRLLNEQEDAYLAGTYDPWRDNLNEAVTIEKAVERYLAAKKREGMRQGSIDWRKNFFKHFTDALPAGTLAGHVTPEDVKGYVNRPPSKGAKHTKREGQLSPHTKRTYYAQLHSLFEWCQQKRLVDENPAERVQRPRVPPANPAIEHLTPEQLDQFYEAVEQARMVKEAKKPLPYPRSIVWINDVVRFAVGTGLRLGEIVRLRWRDVDLSQNVLYVLDTEAGQTKTESSRRPVPIVPFVREVLVRQAELRASEDPDHPVFTSPASGCYGKGVLPLSAETTSRTFRKYRRKIGADEGIDFHALRKTCGVVLASKGVPMRMIQKILGHSDMRTTSQVYTDVWGDELGKEMRRAFEDFSK